MNSARTTRLLLVLLGLSIVACAIAASRAGARRDSALSAQTDLLHVRQDIAHLTSSVPGTPTSNVSGARDVNRLVRQAATDAGAIDALAGLEPGRLNEAGEVPVIVGFTPLTLKQVVSFIHALAIAPNPVRTDAIELSAADASGGLERRTATVTISIRSSR